MCDGSQTVLVNESLQNIEIDAVIFYPVKALETELRQTTL
jgi:hypothetical protein